MYNHILSIVLFTPHGGSCTPAAGAQGKQAGDSLDRQHLRVPRVRGLVAAGSVVLGTEGPCRLPVRRRRAQQLDPHHRRGLRHRHRRHLVPADHADDAAGRDLNPVVVERHSGSRQGVLHLVPGAADRHVGRLHGQRHVPLLRFLGGHAGPDVPADRHLGRPAQAVRGNQVFPVHPVRLGADAAGQSCSCTSITTR